MSDAQLEILASRAGLAVDWIDANGRPQKVAPAVLRNVLIGLGHPASTAQEIDASLLELQAVQQDRHLPPLLTSDVGVGVDLARYFAPETPCEIHLEDGSRLNLKLDSEADTARRDPGRLSASAHRRSIFHPGRGPRDAASASAMRSIIRSPAPGA